MSAPDHGSSRAQRVARIASIAGSRGNPPSNLAAAIEKQLAGLSVSNYIPYSLFSTPISWNGVTGNASVTKTSVSNGTPAHSESLAVVCAL